MSRYICKKHPSPVCGTNWEWVAATQHCYQFSEDSLNWSDARLECKRDDHITARELSYIWIGLNDQSRTGFWQWSDNSTLTSLNWIKGN
ncbi:CD209 antigen-like protein C [Patella vulgata]|uniref:CD209 antigen-like protein C n=1 Tax=Patella vulgata TaxID=6465 RepID=UPI0024A8D013|nr:CD209 antigen-like protein C [Patella vulgata]